MENFHFSLVATYLVSKGAKYRIFNLFPLPQTKPLFLVQLE